jgi:hypothetical protein
MKKITLLLTLFVLTSCSLNPKSFIEVDRVEAFSIDNYSDFYVKINETSLSAEINPIALEGFRDDLKNALIDSGLSFSEDSKLIFEINITSKDEIESDNLNHYHSRYNWDRYYRDNIRTISKFILRVNLRDIESNNTVFTAYADWRKGSPRSPEKEDGSNLIVEEIMATL